MVFLPSAVLDDQLEITNGFLDLKFIGYGIIMLWVDGFITLLYYLIILYFCGGPLIFLHKCAILQCTTLHTFERAISFGSKWRALCLCLAVFLMQMKPERICTKVCFFKSFFP